MSTVKLFKDAQAIDSLRNSDFDAHSAYGEVLDNSIQAMATKVRVNFSTKVSPGDGAVIRSVSFADNGTGMTKQTLHQCLQLGWSSRYNNRDGIGRFGVGMTLAAIHECKRVEVWSRADPSAPWFQVQMDLDELASMEDAELPEPTPCKSLPTEHVPIMGGFETGTLVVWSKYDRWTGSSRELEELIEDFRVYCGRTYRKFIYGDRKLTITVDGKQVCAIDPLYHFTEFTKFPDDAKAELYQDIKLNWPRDDGNGDDVVTIRLSLLPEELRLERGKGASEAARSRYIDRNEGISILRNDREVFYGEPPYWATGKERWHLEEIDRWWGCEISFPASLDRAFEVKNIKRGARATPKLRELLKKYITPTRNTALELVRKTWAQTELSEVTRRTNEGSTQFRTGHEQAEAIAATTKTPKGKLDKGIDSEASQNSVLQTLTQFSDIEKASLRQLFKIQPFTIINAEWTGVDFIESCHMGGAAVLKYNMRHVFHSKTKELMDALKNEPEKAADIADSLRCLIDLTFIAYAKAETQFTPDEDMSARDYIEFMRSHWGQYLRLYVTKWESDRDEI